MRYNIDSDLNPGLPSIISEYYGPHSFFHAKQIALARLYEWREQSLTQIHDEYLSEKSEGWNIDWMGRMAETVVAYLFSIRESTRVPGRSLRTTDRRRSRRTTHSYIDC